MADPIHDGAALAVQHAGKYRVVGYAELRAKASKLAEQILRAHGGQPDSLVLAPILLGGGLPARLVADTLMASGLVHDVAPCRIRRYDAVGRSGQLEFALPLDAKAVAGRIVIGIDDMVDGGETMAAFLEHARTQGAAEAEAAVIFAKPHSTVTPDYCAEAGVTEWLVMPGEEHDFMTHVSRTDHAVRGLDASEARRYFVALGLAAGAIEQWQAATALMPAATRSGVQ